MTSRFILSMLLLSVAVPSAHALIERQLVKTFPTSTSGAVLSVETFSGEIRITPTDGDSVEITVLQQCDEKT
jgi:hypothetical protein